MASRKKAVLWFAERVLGFILTVSVPYDNHDHCYTVTSPATSRRRSRHSLKTRWSSADRRFHENMSQGQKRLSDFWASSSSKRQHMSETSSGTRPRPTGNVSPKQAQDDIRLQEDQGPSQEHQGTECSRLDIGLYQNVNQIDNVLKHQLLTSPWRPGRSYEFKCVKDLKQKRKFQLAWLDKYPWLSYSALCEGSFCRVCALFCRPEVGKGRHASTGALVSRACRDWKHALELFDSHQNTVYHRESQSAADHFIKAFSSGALTVVEQLDSSRKLQIKENRKRLAPIVDTIIFCGRQGLSLRGHNDSGPLDLDSAPTENEGNFRALLRMRSSCGDSYLKEHIQNCSGNASYLSPTVQNEIVEICGTLIRENLVSKINNAGCFSVLADETTDVAGIEQLTICARYLDKGSNQVDEVFLGFVPVDDQSGRNIAREIVKFLVNVGIDMENLRGQGYDGASAMAGKANGVQAAIREKYPTALYTHCASHCLNLVLCAACSVADIRHCFGTVKETAKFFRKSASRSNVLRAKIADVRSESRRKRLLGLCETRWVEKHDALLSFVSLFDCVIAALVEIELNGSSENAAQANNMISALLSPSFIVGLHVAEHVLAVTLPLSRQLQAKNSDMCTAIGHIDVVQRTIEQYRTNAEACFGEVFSKAQECGERHNVEIAKPRIRSLQQHRGNDHAESAEEYFRRSVYIPFIDFILSQLKQRFENHRRLIESFGALIPAAVPPSHDARLRQAKELILAFSNDVDEIAALGEFRLWWTKWESTGPSLRPSTGLDALPHCDSTFYPNIYKLLQILVTLPLTTATAERSFSSLRRLKTYLRSTMSEERLVGLALLYCHRDININHSDVIDRFAKLPRRLGFVL